MPRFCRVIMGVFALAWLGAVVLLLIGIFGLFGQEQDPLSGIFLVLLGLPWNLYLDGLPEGAQPWAAALAPGVTLVVLRLICGRLPRST